MSWWCGAPQGASSSKNPAMTQERDCCPIETQGTELAIQSTSEVSQASHLVELRFSKWCERPHKSEIRGMAELGEFARKSPWGRTQGQCWLQSRGTAPASPVPAQLHVPGTAWAQQGHTQGAGTAATAAKPGSPSAARALLALEGTR